MAEAMGATEDAAARRAIAGRRPGVRRRLHHSVVRRLLLAHIRAWSASTAFAKVLLTL